MKYEIMLKILFVLLAKRKVTASWLASRFSLSTRTIMRYIDVISLVVPLISESGRNGGFYIADSYKLPASFLTEKEFNAVVSVLSSYNQDLSNKTISSAIDKLIATKPFEKQMVNVKHGHLIIDGSSWNGNDNVKNIISLISDAIDEQKLTVISYVDKSGNHSVRTIEPHAIILKQGLWYVYAYCTLRNSFRMFKASRIEYADVKDATFNKRDVEITTLTLGKWFENLPVEKIELEVSPLALSDVEEWLGITNVYKTDNVYFASASLPYDNWLISKILSFGGNVKIISPQKLKDDVKKMAENIAISYK